MGRLPWGGCAGGVFLALLTAVPFFWMGRCCYWRCLLFSLPVLGILLPSSLPYISEGRTVRMCTGAGVQKVLCLMSEKSL